MSEKLNVKKPIYPLIGFALTILILVIGLITAKKSVCTFYAAAVWLLFLVFGYYKSCFAVIPFIVVFGGAFGLITWLISSDISSSMAAVRRIVVLCTAIIPGLALPSVVLVRNFAALKLPRMLTLGMLITLNFFPLLGIEVKQVSEAMKTRGAGSIWNPKIFYRAFLIPLLIRLVNISDTLALSVETRGFDVHSKGYSVYKTVSLKATDIVALALIIVVSVAAVIL